MLTNDQWRPGLNSAMVGGLMHRSRSAFTMLELMLAIGLAVIVLALAIPAIGNLFEEDEMQRTYDKFGEFVQKAQQRAVKERRTMLLVWHERDAKHEGGLSLEPEVLSSDEAESEPETFGFGDAEMVIERPFALEDKPLPEWPFWRSGTCEPVKVTYRSKAGHWVAAYDPLTARGTILEMDNR